MITVLITIFALFSFPVNATCMRGLDWATDNRLAPIIGDKPQITWFYHWEKGPVPQMPSKNEYVPMYWGPSKENEWRDRLKEMNRDPPKHLVAFNEPDLDSQAHMTPIEAAQLYMDQIYPWSTNHGTKLGSPAVAWDLNWLDAFLNEVQKKGGHVDFITLHWYSSYKDLEGFKKFVQTAYSRFGKIIWVTEMGIISSSNPSQRQVKQFMMDASSWMNSQSQIERWAWFGAFKSSEPPDSFATGKNALFNPDGKLSDMGYWYAYSLRPDRRSVKSRHHLISRAGASEPEPAPESEAIHCDKICQLRNAQISSYEAEIARPAP